MQPMWLCILWSRPFEDTFWNAQWGKAKPMQPVWLSFPSCRRFEETFENAQWGKAKQMQPLLLCILSGRPFNNTSENAHWRKAIQMQPMWLCILLDPGFEEKAWKHLIFKDLSNLLDLIFCYLHSWASSPCPSWQWKWLIWIGWIDRYL